MTNEQWKDFVLSVYPFSRGFAFVLFEAPDSPFDWGVKEVKERHKNRNTKTLAEIKKLIERYRPLALIIEDAHDKSSRRTSRIKKLYALLAVLAANEGADLCAYSATQVRETFGSVGALTKHEIARAIARRIPAFAHRMPPIRKPWMSEDPRQSLFDAVALGLTYFARGVRSPYTDDVS